MSCVTVVMRDLHFLSVFVAFVKLTITDSCESFILFLTAVQDVLQSYTISEDNTLIEIDCKISIYYNLNSFDLCLTLYLDILNKTY